MDPSAERRAAKAVGADTFGVMAREFMEKQRRNVTDSTWQPDIDQLERIFFPTLGAKAISSIEAPDLLACLQRVEKAGDVETAHRARGLAGRVFRYAIASGKAKHDVAADLRGALEPAIKRSYPADVIELQLAHKDKDETRRTYNRAARLMDRRKMMNAWADYLDLLKARGDVIQIRKQA